MYIPKMRLMASLHTIWHDVHGFIELSVFYKKLSMRTPGMAGDTDRRPTEDSDGTQRRAQQANRDRRTTSHSQASGSSPPHHANSPMTPAFSRSIPLRPAPHSVGFQQLMCSGQVR
jgi:hypothetical protein